jgi:hypothetical protein
MSSRKWNAVFAITAMLMFFARLAPAGAQPIEYVKICDAFGTGFYYIPGTDTCLKLGGYVKYEPVPTGTQKPPPPAGCANCAELDKAIARLTEQFNKLNGKGVPAWQEDIASDIANLRERKADCAKVCAPPPARTTQRDEGEEVKICSPYGAGFYYIPGTDTCLRITRTSIVSEKLPGNVRTPPPPAGCSSCVAFDSEIAALRVERAEWVAKKNATFVSDIDSQIAKLTALKTGCQSTCQRTAEKPKPQTPPQRSQTPPQKSQTPPQKFAPPIDRGTLH